MMQENDEILLPMIPGNEFSGEVLEVGGDCRLNFKPGDKVAALLGKFGRLSVDFHGFCVPNLNWFL